MHDINPFVQIDKHEAAITSENAFEIMRDYDIVVDGTDNFPTRYLVNDACVLLGKPNVYGSIFRFEGQATVFAYENGPCYRCLYPEPPAPAPGLAEGEIDPAEVKAKIDRHEPFVLIDVREPHEYQIAHIPYAKLIPLGELPKRVNELNSADEIVAHCKSGMRSAKAVDFLKQAGFRKVKNMKGGILAWSDKVDPTVPKY